MSNKTQVPQPLSAQDKHSFAYKTVKDRLPVILVKSIDFFHRQRKELHKFGTTIEHPNEVELQEIETDAKNIIAQLTKLRKDVETNKSVELFSKLDLEEKYQFFNDDIDQWNKALEASKLADGSLPRYFDSPWLLVECYLYRQLKNITLSTKHLKMIDPFIEQKQVACASSLNQMQIIAKHLLSIDSGMNCSFNSDTHFNERKEFGLFTLLSLWGNKYDLSLSEMNADKVKTHKYDNMSDLRDLLDSFNENILCDNTSEVWFKVQSIKSQFKTARKGDEEIIYIDLVVDNAGYEIFVDFCLIHFLWLLITGGKDAEKPVKFRLHLKRLPWFVSDAMKPDIDWLLSFMKSTDKDSPTSDLAKKWASFIDSKLWEIYDHKFWTLPHDFSEMSSIAEDLYEELSKSKLIIFKGDLNYRKLTGDRKWHILTPFKVALRQFQPAPLVALRTAKADVVVGIEDVNIYARINNNELPRDWMVSGDFALIQFAQDQ